MNNNFIHNDITWFAIFHMCVSSTFAMRSFQQFARTASIAIVVGICDLRRGGNFDIFREIWGDNLWPHENRMKKMNVRKRGKKCFPSLFSLTDEIINICLRIHWIENIQNKFIEHKMWSATVVFSLPCVGLHKWIWQKPWIFNCPRIWIRKNVTCILVRIVKYETREFI